MLALPVNGTLLEQVERLSDSREVFAVVWVLMNPRNELLHGEIHDSSGRVRGRFRGWEDLMALLRATLES